MNDSLGMKLGVHLTYVVASHTQINIDRNSHTLWQELMMYSYDVVYTVPQAGRSSF